MSRLPKSWGLKTKKRGDGKLDILGKTDAGETYKVRTTDTSEITDSDITALRENDREAYTGRPFEPGSPGEQFVAELMGSNQAAEAALNDAFGDEMVEAAGPVAFALLDRKAHSSPFTGSTHAFREGWERAFGKEN